MYRIFAVFLLASPAFSAEPITAFDKANVDFYKQKVVPILNENCMKCHGDKPEKLSGGLDLRTRASLLAGGDTGPAAIPGKAKESLLVIAIRHGKEGYEMPPNSKLKDDQIAVLVKWVDNGLAFPPDLLGSDKLPAQEVHRRAAEVLGLPTDSSTRDSKTRVPSRRCVPSGKIE